MFTASQCPAWFHKLIGMSLSLALMRFGLSLLPCVLLFWLLSITETSQGCESHTTRVIVRCTMSPLVLSCLTCLTVSWRPHDALRNALHCSPDIVEIKVDGVLSLCFIPQEYFHREYVTYWHDFSCLETRHYTQKFQFLDLYFDFFHPPENQEDLWLVFTQEFTK